MAGTQRAVSMSHVSEMPKCPDGTVKAMEESGPVQQLRSSQRNKKSRNQGTLA